ncbi:hypothetical protein [Jiangella asiatica]|uniref:Uncharacterized protein n=1 Tax=Jiangella asiatica TaxID=2530372 RepID=A0A4R5DJD2_9ACTN|nr:hypothetical protein [Jiangella asiatica]TDE10915.1 hypothetical protein E1269_10560 [Jiangella asiatica]
MSSSMPAPRPALLRAADGTVRPAAAHLSSLAVDEAAVAKAAKKHKKKGHPADDDAELLVHLSKRDRKRLRRKAETYGWTAEQAAAHVLRVWSDS